MFDPESAALALRKLAVSIIAESTAAWSTEDEYNPEMLQLSWAGATAVRRAAMMMERGEILEAVDALETLKSPYYTWASEVLQ